MILANIVHQLKTIDARMVGVRDPGILVSKEEYFKITILSPQRQFINGRSNWRDRTNLARALIDSDKASVRTKRRQSEFKFALTGSI